MFAATDTTSNSLAQILYKLVQHPDAQERLREEIIQAGNGQDILYDQLLDLPYLDAVCRETLRVLVTTLPCIHIVGSRSCVLFA